jgi:hypothetical protein
MREFQRQYGADEPCEAALFTSRWPSGWSCSRCQCTRFACTHNRRRLWECLVYAYPSSSMVGAVFEHTYLGGERVGKPGRGSENKTAFVAALQTSTDGKPLFMRLFPNEVRARHPSERIVMVIGRWHWPEVLS